MASDLTAPRSFLVRAEEITPGWALLYAVTVGIACACAWLRAAILYSTGALILWLAGWPQLPALVYLALATLPLLASLATIVVPTGGLWWQAVSGGRRPSEREQHVYEQALSELREIDLQLRAPRLWFVVDSPVVNASAYADTLMLNRGLLESGALTAILAHELGHLNTADARLTAALSRLTIRPRQRRTGILGTILFLASGSFALWLTGIPWANYWRTREYHADNYAARLGQADALADALENHALAHDLPIPYPWIATNSHPPTELRIERLRAALHPQASPGQPLP